MAIDINQFARSKIYAVEAQPDEVVADMATLRELDAYSEGKAATWGSVSIACWVLGAMSVMVGLAITPVLLVALGLLGAGFATHLKKRAHANLDIENRRYELVDTLVSLLEADIANDTPLAVEIDFRDPEDKAKHTRSGQAGHWDVEYFTDPWLAIRGRFIDGTSFALSFTHNLQKRSRWKSSRSGKRKYKSKRKIKNVAVIQLKPKPSKYPALPDVAEGLEQALQLPRHATPIQARVRDGRMMVKAAVRDGWREDGPSGSQVFALGLLSMYQVLNLAKAIDKRSQKPSQAG